MQFAPEPGTGNIELDPLFVNPASVDFSYQPNSPCIDTGDPTLFDPDGSRSDIGAVFYNPQNNPDGDCNEDGQLDALDIVYIVAMCIQCDEDCPDCLCADVNLDGEIDILDIVSLINNIISD